MRYLVLAVCLLATACAGETPGSPTSPTSATVDSRQTQAQGGEQLPFHGSLQAIETDVVAPPTLLVNGTGSGTGTHLGRFTATFTATVIGHATPTSEPNVVTIEEVATISGGTGRFAGSTGTFTIQRVLTQVTGVSSGSFDGMINLGLERE
jgi:hypothetical protein